jgi:hypothetical protein
VTPASLGLVIGTNVQAYDSDLTTWAGLTPTANAQSIITAANYAAMRTLLDLEAGTDFYSVSAADAAFQPLATVLTNTTASFLTAQETKLGHITITQAVDLDTIESAVASNTTHRTSDGSNHTFLDQSVVSGATPTFTATNITGVPAASILAGTFGTGAYVFDNTVSGITTLTATTLAGTLSTATQNSVTTMTGLVTVSALNSGSITSGFGSIDIGSSTLAAGATTITGSLTAVTVSDGVTITAKSEQNDSSHSTTTPFGSFVVYSNDGSGAGAGVRGGLRVYPASTSGGTAATVITAYDGTGEIEVARFGNDKAVTLAGDLTLSGGDLSVIGVGGFGIARTEGTLHILTASAGSVTANTGADELVLENSGAGGMSILGPDASDQNIFLGSPTDGIGAKVSWNYDGMLFRLGSATVGGTVKIEADNSVQAVVFSGAAGSELATFVRDVTLTSGDLTLSGATAQLFLPQVNDAANPTLAFGDGNTGFYESADNVLVVSLSGGAKFQWSGSNFQADGAGPAFISTTPSATVPTVLPNKSDGNTGLGHIANDKLTLVAGGVEGIRITEAGSAITAIDLKGPTNVTGTLSVAPSASGATAHSSGDDAVFETSGATGISILGGDSSSLRLVLGSPSDNLGAFINWQYSSGILEMGSHKSGAVYRLSGDAAVLNLTLSGASSSELATFVRDVTMTNGDLTLSAGSIFVGDTANANMTVGLTINQGANDDEIFALKSSDIAHGVTSLVETDTFLSIKKRDANGGGIRMTAVAESAITTAMDLRAYAGTANTTHATNGDAFFEVSGYQTSGTDVTNSDDGANVFGVKTMVGGGTRMLFIIDENGNYHYDGADGGAFDEYDDVSLVRAFAHATSDPRQIIKNKWDEYVSYNEQTLIDTGVLGASVSQGGLVNGAQLQRLHTGAIWQIGSQMMDQQEQIEDLSRQLVDAQAHIKQLMA